MNYFVMFLTYETVPASIEWFCGGVSVRGAAGVQRPSLGRALGGMQLRGRSATHLHHYVSLLRLARGEDRLLVCVCVCVCVRVCVCVCVCVRVCACV